ncbi:MAG: hypothetical protein JWQ98_747 [Chlorobi bacterium]|nr:hypothetical protein [Chlorobiota bacterium]
MHVVRYLALLWLLPIAALAQGSNMVSNPGFIGTYGTGIGPDNIPPWLPACGTPDARAGNGCSDTGYIAMWGNKFVGEAIKEKLFIRIRKDSLYTCSLCMRASPDVGRYFRARVVAFSTTPRFDNFHWDIQEPQVALIGSAGTASLNWRTLTFPPWKAPADYDSIAINVENDSADYTNPATVSWGNIDGVNLEKVSKCILSVDSFTVRCNGFDQQGHRLYLYSVNARSDIDGFIVASTPNGQATISQNTIPAATEVNITGTITGTSGTNDPLCLYVSLITGNGLLCRDSICIPSPLPAPLNSRDTICTGGAITLDAPDGIAWRWRPATGLSCADCQHPTASPDVSTRYLVETTGRQGCVSVDTADLQVAPLPVITAGTKVTICLGGSTELLVSGGAAYRWSPATGLSCTTCPNPIASPTEPTVYTVTVTSAAGCSANASITVLIDSATAMIRSISRDTTICAGEGAHLIASGADRYQWSPATGLGCVDCADPIASPAVTTRYTCTFISVAGCSARDSVLVTVAPPPAADAGADTTICAGGEAALSGSGGTGYNWSPADAISCTDCRNPVARPLITTTYTLRVTNAAGCSATDSVTVHVLPLPSADAGPDVAACPGESITLSASGGTTYAWSPAEGLSCADCQSPVATPLRTTVYHLTAINAAGCAATDSVTVNLRAAPTVTASGDTDICPARPARLHASGASVYRWRPATALSCTDCPDPVATPLVTTTYVVSGTDAHGCTGEDTVIIRVGDGTRTITAHIDRDHHLLPGSIIAIPIILDSAADGAATLEIALGYERRFLRLKRISTDGTLLDGWAITTLTDSLGAVRVRLDAPPGRTLRGRGTLATIDLAGYLADTVESELPFSITLPAGSCDRITALPGHIRIDSICGLNLRLIRVTVGNYSLAGNRPNPFNPSTEISFSLGLDGPTTLAIYDAAGNAITTLIDTWLRPGSYTVAWDASGQPSGIYYYRMTSGAWSGQGRMLLVK